MPVDVECRLVPILIFCLIVLAPVGFAGCGGNQNSGFPLRGRVLFDNKGVYPGSIILMSAEGETVSANLSSAGEFFVPNAKKTRYTASIQTQKLANLSRAQASGNAENQESAEDESQTKPLRREDTIPSKFKNANVDIPDRYRSLKTSGLTFDFSEGIPDKPLEIRLEQ